MSSPTQRTLALLRRKGYTCAITEHWNHHTRIRQDLFGFIDILCLKKGESPIAIQTTTSSHHATRVAKIKASPLARVWLSTGCPIFVVSWRKAGKAGKRKLWTARWEQIGDFTTFQEVTEVPA